MGSGLSQEQIQERSLRIYNDALNDPCLLPDVGIDESLLKYSGLDSNFVLQTYSNDLAASVPGFINSLGSALTPYRYVPNAVGLGALVLSIIMEICIKSAARPADYYGLLRRVFGEEKASAVRDTMSEYVKRHRIFINQEQRLLQELQRLEQQLSNHLTILRNSLLLDGQMNTRGLKIWVNGAFFHVQMMIHEARLKNKTPQRVSEDVESIGAAITLHLQHLDHLLEKYKSYKISITEPDIVNPPVFGLSEYGGFSGYRSSVIFKETVVMEYIRNTETGCVQRVYNFIPSLIEGFVNVVYSKYEPVTGLKNKFSNVKNNLNSLIRQHQTFSLPTA